MVSNGSPHSPPFVSFHPCVLAAAAGSVIVVPKRELIKTETSVGRQFPIISSKIYHINSQWFLNWGILSIHRAISAHHTERGVHCVCSVRCKCFSSSSTKRNAWCLLCRCLGSSRYQEFRLIQPPKPQQQFRYWCPAARECSFCGPFLRFTKNGCNHAILIRNGVFGVFHPSLRGSVSVDGALWRSMRVGHNRALCLGASLN